ncbi:THUMP-like domain-containing protein [Gaetbulibacter aestuarii]|uniref:Class I SAM-dependent methyltransferase n=1 Tax=Gaetbulibacter aestuarii TaxID=1502358 RepID=A0ABW7MZC3_9FLAO
MNTAVLNTEVQEFINKNLNTDLPGLVLKQPELPDVTTDDLIQQIESKKRCEKKLPTWFHSKNIYYPNKLNIEQTSSERTADYKSTLISGKSLIDITGGFGVDAFYFSKAIDQVTHCEINPDLSQIVTHNFSALEVENITCIASDGLEYLKNSKDIFDWIYVDPSRRDANKSRVFFLKDCLPNVPENLNILFDHSKDILIKTAPLLDLSAGLNELKSVKQIHVVSVNNEVKELLWILQKGFSGTVEVITVNLKNKKTEIFQFNLEEEKKAHAHYSEPLSYLYEPNASILKAGAFQMIAEKYKINKLHKHTHLYTNETLIEFPGRRFMIENVIPFNKKDIKKVGIKKANITTRNFPENVKQIRQKFNISDGGEAYLFFTKDLKEKKMIVVCNKIE